MPPLRELAPQPTVSASKAAMRAPAFASVRAADNPVKPAPITATSTLSGKGCGAGVGISTVFSQNVFSLMVMESKAPAILRGRAAAPPLRYEVSNRAQQDCSWGAKQDQTVVALGAGADATGGRDDAEENGRGYR